MEAYLAEIAEVPVTDVRQTRLVVRLPHKDPIEFEHRLQDLLEEFRDRSDNGGGEQTAIYFATYPSR